MSCASCSRPLPEDARFCPFCGHEVVASATEERRVVTVVFADLVGYTSLSEHLDPERVKRLIDGAFELLVADIEAYGGQIDKILGDGILALFGAPVAHEDDPDRAVRASLEMRQSLQTFSHGQLDLAVPLQLRVGVNTGEVVVGSSVGNDDYTAMGDVVNVASRLQTLAQPDSILMGAATEQLVSDEILREVLDDVPVRGRTQAERVWRVLGRQRRWSRRAHRSVKFVGRCVPRDLMASMMASVADGQSAVVSVTGEAGAGKTRFITETLGKFPDRRVTVLAGACAPYGETNVWSAVANALTRPLDIDLAAPTDELRSVISERGAERYGIANDDPALDSYVETMMHLIGRPSELDAMSPSESREALFRFVTESLRRRSRQGPVVLWIDDLQWADSLVVDLLHRLMHSLVDRPLLLLTSQRDDATVDWPPPADDAIVINIPLQPLSHAESDELVRGMLGGLAGRSMLDQLFERSGGNPLFLTELATLARSQQGSNELPGTLRALIAARLDQLTPARRALLDNAAVLGNSGPTDALQRFAVALGQPFDADELLQLDDAHLLEIDHDWWHFRSDVVREVAYQMLTKQVRAQRHSGVALAMSTRTETLTDQVAHHYATAAELVAEIGPVDRVPADVCGRAIKSLLSAARRSINVGAFNQSIRHTTRALALADGDPTDERELLLLRAEGAVNRRETEQADADASQALASAIEAGDQAHEGRARRTLGMVDQMGGDIDSARRHLGRSVDIFRDLGDDIELAASLRERGFAEVFGGSLRDADWLLGEAEALTESLNDRRGRAWVRQHQAWVAFLSGDTALAEQRLTLASAEFAEFGDRSGAMWAQGLFAFVRFFQFRFDEAEELAVTVRDSSREMGERWSPAMMDTLIASIRLWSGNFTEAEELSRRALTVFRDLNDPFGLVQALGPHNRALVALGRDQEAERGLEEVTALADIFGDLAFPVMAAAGTAVHLGLGERATVLGELAVERVTAMGADGVEARVTYALALCQTARAEDALIALDGLVLTTPYGLAVRALAGAMLGDDVQALDDADAVAAHAGASYLDRVYAAVAALAVLSSTDRHAEAVDRLALANEAANDADDAVALALVAHAAGAFVHGGARGDLAHLRAGWLRVIDGLGGLPLHPSVT